jgi:hypothetical protein
LEEWQAQGRTDGGDDVSAWIAGDTGLAAQPNIIAGIEMGQDNVQCAMSICCTISGFDMVATTVAANPSKTVRVNAADGMHSSVTAIADPVAFSHRNASIAYTRTSECTHMRTSMHTHPQRRTRMHTKRACKHTQACTHEQSSSWDRQHVGRTPQQQQQRLRQQKPLQQQLWQQQQQQQQLWRWRQSKQQRRQQPPQQQRQRAASSNGRPPAAVAATAGQQQRRQ